MTEFYNSPSLLSSYESTLLERNHHLFWDLLSLDSPTQTFFLAQLYGDYHKTHQGLRLINRHTIILVLFYMVLVAFHSMSLDCGVGASWSPHPFHGRLLKVC